MAKKYKVKKNKNSFLSKLFPEPVQAFMARRIVDGMALFFIISGLFITISLLSYSPEDSSFNVANAGTQKIENIFGHAGANVSDLLIQTIGAGGFLLATILIIWGASIFKRRSLKPFWFRLTILFPALILSSGFLAIIPAFDFFDRSYFGGSLGFLLLQNTADFIHGIGLGGEYVISSIFYFLTGSALLALAAAVSRDEAKTLIAYSWFVITTVSSFVFNTAVAFYDWVRHYSNPDYKPARQKKQAQKPAVTKTTPSVSKPTVIEKTETVQDTETQNNTDLSAIKVFTPQKAEKTSGASQTRFQLFDGGEWELPSLELLQDVPEDIDDDQPDEKALRMNAEMLQNVLEDFNIKGEIVSIHPGPVVTLYELEPAPGVKSSRVIGLADDIARSMSAISVRAAVVPGRNVIGIEIPNKKRQTVYMRDMLTTREYAKTKASLPLVLGKDIGGRPIIADLARMPHLLVAGTTGSGKSVAVNTMIMSLLYALPPEKCRFIMIDPKMLELSVYDDIPHLLSPVVTEPGKAIVALKWLVGEMEERYRAMSKLGVRNIDGYNARLGKARKEGEALMRKVQTGFDPGTGKAVYEEQPLDLNDLPYIVVIVDEFADLMLVAGKDVEAAIQRLAQMARAAGIHIIMATQRPSVDVITGVIKANFPTRISFSVTSKIDSRTILGEGGAEQLLGMGDMLYRPVFIGRGC